MKRQIMIAPVRQPEKMISYWKKEWKVLAGVIFFGLLFNGSMSLGPILQGFLLDSVIAGDTLRRITSLAVFFVAVMVLIQIARILKRYFVRLFANRTSASMRLNLYHTIMSLDAHALSGESIGDLMNKAVADVDICVEGMRKVTTEFFDTGVLMAAYLITLLLYDVNITLASCLFIPAAMLLAEYLKKRIVKYTAAARKQSSLVAELTYRSIEHTILYRIHGIEGANRELYTRESADLSAKSIKSNILENSMQPVYNAISLLGITAILFYGGRNVIDGAWSIGMFSAYLVIFTSLTTKASKAARLFNSFQKAAVSWKRIKPYLLPYETMTPQTDFPESPCQLIVNNMSFSYPDTDVITICDICFSAKEGDFLGVTGNVACGKSTLGLALCGLSPYKGEISLNGRELSSYTKEQRSQRISYMGHAPLLLSDTIYENITLGIPGDITQVLQDVCFERDLAQMPDGIHTKVGSRGVRLSGGQQARIALARAIYHESQILILDDPFSAVDMTTEKSIMENLRSHYSRRIILLISHRLSLFPLMDKILFFDENKQLSEGTHRSLFSESASYRTVYQLQTGDNTDET